eukprot:3156112-Rhodomonas_salina.1
MEGDGQRRRKRTLRVEQEEEKRERAMLPLIHVCARARVCFRVELTLAQAEVSPPLSSYPSPTRCPNADTGFSATALRACYAMSEY